MDTLKLLLGATMALLVGALIVFVGQMKNGVENASKEDIHEMRQQMAELDREIERLSLEKERRTLRSAVDQSSSLENVKLPQEPEDTAQMEAELARLQKEAEEAKKAAQLAQDEASFLVEDDMKKRDKMARRTSLINQAMLIATITQWVEDPNLGGGFAILNVHRPENGEEGAVLAIRRNGGILGKLRIDQITPDGAIANPIGQFGPVKPEAGDELILNEVVEFAN